MQTILILFIMILVSCNKANNSKEPILEVSNEITVFNNTHPNYVDSTNVEFEIPFEKIEIVDNFIVFTFQEQGHKWIYTINYSQTSERIKAEYGEKIKLGFNDKLTLIERHSSYTFKISNKNGERSLLVSHKFDGRSFGDVIKISEMVLTIPWKK